MHSSFTSPVRRPVRGRDSGIALITVIMVMMLVSVLMVGFVSAIVADNRSSGLDHDQTQAYAATHAGLEKLTSDLSALFLVDFSPSATQINALTTTASRPNISGFQYLAPDGTSGYTITWLPDGSGNPAPEDPVGSTISHGPYQGFKGIITPYEITVTARSNGGAETRMKRTLQTISVPVFQFGMFSETDLAFHAGDTFGFGGRVHTNGNLFLAEADGGTLTMSDRVTAVGEVIRTHLPNGLITTSGYNGTVRVPTTITANPANNVYRNLTRTEGSLIGTVGSAPNQGPPTWTSLSVGTYNSNIRNGLTGAKRLDLPLVSQGARPIDLVRRPLQNSNESVVAPLLYQQRYFGMASLRIILSDSSAELTNLPTVLVATPPVDLNNVGNLYAGAAPPLTRPPLAGSPANPAVVNGALPASIYKSTNAPLIGGFIKIEMQRQAGGWVDVTQEILGLGIAGRNLATNTPATALNARWNNPSTACPEINPNAVIRLQRVRDVPFNTTTANTAAMMNTACGYAAGVVPNVSPLATDYWPNVLYDPREGTYRDGLGLTDLFMGGVVSYIELDMNNLRRWLTGAIGATGNQARNDNGNGFIVYFSDRRNNKNPSAAQCGAIPAPCETGEYGYEDVTNPNVANGLPNNVLDAGEDLNGNGVLDVYGATPVAANVPNAGVAPFNTTGRPGTLVPAGVNDALVARANRVVHFRRALKIVNGGIVGGVNSIVAPGLTIASENPVYIQGNFNATAASASVEPNVATAIISDAVTVLSNNWNDIRSFVQPSDATLRPASTTAYRVGIVTGKTLAFPQPAGSSASFGSDGGVHNFLRALEDWNTPAAILRYRGSMVSFFISRQATGTFKCCWNDVYVRGARDWTFDTDFLTPSLLPPGTPMFRDINTLTFRQILRPNQ